MKTISKKLCDGVKTIFSSELNDSKQKIFNSLSQQETVLVNDAIITNFIDSLIEYHVWRLCHKAFVYEFHKYREQLSEPASSLSSKVFDMYVESLDSKEIANWFSKFEYLGVLVENTVKNTCCYLEEVFHNFAKDSEELATEKFIQIGDELKNVTFLDSDPHNGSKIVLCFEFDSERKILYKPKSLEIDLVLEKIFSEILRFKSLQNFSPIAQTVNGTSYGWQRFINSSPTTKNAIDEAYYNLGLCTAVFSVLGATDMHDENVIFNDTTPYFIDLETALQPTYIDSATSLSDTLEASLNHSVVGTGILPAKIVTFPFKILIGAINTPDPQETNEMIFSWKNFGTDATDIAKDKIIVTRDTVPLRLEDGSAPNPLPYQKDFVQGYIDGYAKVKECRAEIKRELLNVNFPVRVIQRPTMQYTFLFDACLFPENLVSEETMQKKLEYLKPPRLIRDSKISKQILKEEILSLKNGDIPYFYNLTNEKCIQSQNFCSGEACVLSSAENALEALEKMSDQKLLFDQRIIAEGYSEIRNQMAENKKESMEYDVSPLFKKTLEVMSPKDPYPLIDLLCDLAISTSNEHPETAWIGGVYGELPISYNSIPFVSFHDTGGILCVLEHLNDYDAKSENIKIQTQAIRGLKSLQTKYFHDLKLLPESVISGPSSFEYLFDHKLKRLKKVEEHARIERMRDEQTTDIFNGKPGLALLLSSFSETPLELLKELQKDIHFEYDLNNYTKIGIAHGRLGLLWGYFRLAHALNDKQKCLMLYDEAKKSVLEKSFKTAGWCNGNAGALMVLIEMSAILGDEAIFYDVADRATVLPETGSVDLSICHGAAGVLQSLLFAFQITGDSFYLSKANEYWANALSLAKKNGFYTGEENRDYILGYFLGWGGVADSALLLNIINSGKSVWFPLNISSTQYQTEYFKKRM